MPLNASPLRPGANNTVPNGLPVLVTVVGTPGVAQHTLQPLELDEVHLWFETNGQAGVVNLEVIAPTALFSFNMGAGTDAPIKILDGIPLRGGGVISAWATAVANVANVVGYRVRGTNRRPLQPVRTATPTGQPVVTGAADTLLHTIEPGSIDEVHLWMHNPTAGNLPVAVNVSPNALGTVGVALTTPTIAARTTVKVMDGLQLRGAAGVVQTISAIGAGLTAYGYFLRR